MSRHLTPVDIRTLNPTALLRLVEEVNTTKQPRLLKRESKTLAMLMPVGTAIKPRKSKAKTKADDEAFRSAAGSWKEVDTDSLLKNIYADRRRANTRPPVTL